MATATKSRTTPSKRTTTTARATPATAAAPAVEAEDDTLRKKAMIDRVVAGSGVKRKDAKAAMEATLEALGKAIAAGEDINLPGLGKMKVNRTQDQTNGTVYICKVRQPKATETVAEKVAEPAE